MNRAGRAALPLPALLLLLLAAAVAAGIFLFERKHAEEERAGYVHRMRSVVAWLPVGADAVGMRVEQVRRALAARAERTAELDLLTDLALAAAGGRADAEDLLRRARDTTAPPKFEGFHRGLCKALAQLRTAEVELLDALKGAPAGPLARAAHAVEAARSLAERLRVELP